MFKKSITVLITITMLLSMLTMPVFAADKVDSFSDVPSTHWAYSAIMDMTGRGLINGTSKPVNGVGTFNPDSTMTRAQFITLITRYMYMDELSSMPTENVVTWYANNYFVALEHGLLKESEFSKGSDAEMNKGMSRQEMAMVLIRAMHIQNPSMETIKMPSSKIPDYSAVGTYYKDYVRECYAQGLICGTDSKGTFSPQGTLTRAQAATVLYRLIEPSTRATVDLSESAKPQTGTQTQTQTPTQTQTETTVTANGTSWVEGQKHDMPKVGDTVIKADGTKVVLKLGYGGILGAGQGVDIYSGYWTIGGGINGTNASGFGDRSKVLKDPITGETHTKDEWVRIEAATLPREDGTKVGEVRNTWFTWDGMFWISSIPRK